MRQSHVLRDLEADWMDFAIDTVLGSNETELLLPDHLNQYFLFLCQSIDDQSPELFFPLLEKWTEIYFDESPEYILDVLLRLFECTRLVLINNLSELEAIGLIQAIVPIQMKIMVYAGHYDKNRTIINYKAQMEKMKSELETLDKSKSDFISVAAHELKTPLTLIDGYLSMFEDTYASSNPDPVYMRYLIEGMGTGASRLKQIVEDMIDVSLIDNDLLSLNFQPVWINRLLGIVELEFKEHILERHQSLIICDFEGAEEMIFADPERILQAFRNLLSNAIKFTPNQGEIIIQGRKLPGFIEITFTDHGIGIAQDEQNRIFDKFHRRGNPLLHSSGKIKYKGGGPGLGLPITKGIIEAHGGALWVESDGYDEVKLPGSVFHVLIPARIEPPDETMAKLFKG